jgi:uncharacterized membrane protein (DUF373 family)
MTSVIARKLIIMQTYKMLKFRNIVAIIIIITVLLPTTHFLLEPKLRRSGAIN